VRRSGGPAHPGQVLLRKYLRPAGLSQVGLAKSLKIPIQRINTIVNGKRGITPETAILLARRFKTSPQVWLNLQNDWDLHQAAKRLASE
jgi:addiction module HigA family antidote